MQAASAKRIQRIWKKMAVPVKCIKCKEPYYRWQLDPHYKCCETCYEDVHYGCHCGDWMCDRTCGVLWCGCVDICRGRCGYKDNVGYMYMR